MIDSNGLLPQYINERNNNTPVPGTDSPMGSISWVWGNIADNGCGVIAIFNVLLNTNPNLSFINVRDMMLSQEAALGFGKLGVSPFSISKILSLTEGYQTKEHTFFNQSAWITTANEVNQIIVLYQWGATNMHYIYGIRCFPPTNGATSEHYFAFYNEGFTDPLSHRMTMTQLLEYFDDNNCTPIWMWGIYK